MEAKIRRGPRLIDRTREETRCERSLFSSRDTKKLATRSVASFHEDTLCRVREIVSAHGDGVTHGLVGAIEVFVDPEHTGGAISADELDDDHGLARLGTDLAYGFTFLLTRDLSWTSACHDFLLLC